MKRKFSWLTYAAKSTQKIKSSWPGFRDRTFEFLDRCSTSWAIESPGNSGFFRDNLTLLHWGRAVFRLYFRIIFRVTWKKHFNLGNESKLSCWLNPMPADHFTKYNIKRTPKRRILVPKIWVKVPEKIEKVTYFDYITKLLSI